MIKKEFFGTTENREVYVFTLENEFLRVKIINFGAIIQSVIVKELNLDVVLGYTSLDEYVKDKNYFGATIGRYANVITDGKFVLNGKEYTLTKNDGNNTLHGGKNGFNKKVWDYAEDGEKLVLSYISKDGEEGFPDGLKVRVLFSLNASAICIEYFAYAENDTAVNLTNHTYFNLNGEGNGSVLEHKVFINSDCEFAEEKSIGKLFDKNFFIKKDSEKSAASATGDKTGLKLSVFTDRPCLQFYTAGELMRTVGKSLYDCTSGLCFETQFEPNDINKKKNSVLRRGERFYSKTIYNFQTRGN